MTAGSPQRFNGQVVVVTGAGSGIGRAIALRFATEGARVVIADIDIAAAAAVVREVNRPEHAFATRTDVSNPAQVEGLFAEVVKRFATVDVLVNNAGIGGLNPALADRAITAAIQMMSGGPGVSLGVTRDLDEDEWRRMLEVHLFGTFYCTRAVLRIMEPRRTGSIINIASTHGLTGFPALPHYSAAKAGIIGFTKSVALEVGGAGIRVNAIAPGLVDTPMAALLPEIARQVALSRTPLGRIGRPEDIAGVALFLASDDAAYVTGQVLSPNGGLYT